MSNNETDSDRFVRQGLSDILRLPARRTDSDVVTRSASLATLFGALAYSVLPQAFNLPRGGADDEISALAAAAAGALLGTITGIRQLCTERPEARAERRFNVVKGGGGGLLTGFGIAKATPWALLSLADGGIMLGLGTLGLGGVALHNRECQRLCV